MDLIGWVTASIVLALTLALLMVVSQLPQALDAPPAARRRALRRMYRLVGAWQLSIGGLLVVFDRERTRDPLWHAIVGSLSLWMVGLLFLFVLPIFIRRLPGELPDPADHHDVERWLDEP